MTIAELKEDKKQMEAYIAELEEDKKQMKEHYESVVMTDEELIAEFKKRFIIPRFFKRDEIVKQVKREGYVATDEQVDGLIAEFKDDSYVAMQECLKDSIYNMDFDKLEEPHVEESDEEEDSEDDSDSDEEEPEDTHDYTDEVKENPIQEAIIDYETYKEYFAEYYQEEKEHDEDTFFRLELYNKKDPEPYEMSAWSDMYFKIEPDHKKTNKSFDKVKYIEYNTSSCFAMMLCGIDFEDVEE